MDPRTEEQLVYTLELVHIRTTTRPTVANTNILTWGRVICNRPNGKLLDAKIFLGEDSLIKQVYQIRNGKLQVNRKGIVRCWHSLVHAGTTNLDFDLGFIPAG